MTSKPSAPAPPDAPPPGYVASQPQILITPLPDVASFFLGGHVRGEVFVKGLGTGHGAGSGVRSLTVHLTLTDHLPPLSPLLLHDFPACTLYPPSRSPPSTSSPPAFPTSHRFCVPLPPPPHSLPGSLGLPAQYGETAYTLSAVLSLTSGQTITETLRIEGTPPEVLEGEEQPEERPEEVVKTLDNKGVRVRMLLDDARPRLGALLRLGVEVRAKERQKTGVAGLSSQPNPHETLRALRRVRVELFRRVLLPPPAESASSSAPPPASREPQHLTLLYTSGKSMRYPGSSSALPPLRVLFTIPTSQLAALDQTQGQITQSTPYHHVSFFVRATIGFGSASAAPETEGWAVEHPVEIRRPVWREREDKSDHGGASLDVEEVMRGDWELAQGLSEEERRKEEYRIKGQDVVGEGGTWRAGESSGEGAGPLPFEGEAGPSSAVWVQADGLRDEPPATAPTPACEPMAVAADGGPPSFVESERQMERNRERSLSVDQAGERGAAEGVAEPERRGVIDRRNFVGRRGSLGGELGTWIEYDGYETFTVQPPPPSASFGVSGSMDPPREDDDDGNVAGNVAARLGLGAAARREGGVEGLMEQLGLGEGTRVVDLQDDLPPGIDEPSLPALPDFSAHPAHSPTHHAPMTFRRASQPLSHPHAPLPAVEEGLPPPSFDASEAAQARVAVQHQQQQHQAAEAPPGYFGGTGGAPGGGPPAYS